MATSGHVDTFTRDNLPPRAQWPEFRFDLPELQYPERMNCAGVLLDDMVVAGHSGRVALRMSIASLRTTTADIDSTFATLAAVGGRLGRGIASNTPTPGAATSAPKRRREARLAREPNPHGSV